VLLSPEVCLDPSLPPEQRAVTDTPPLPEVCIVVLLLCRKRGAVAYWLPYGKQRRAVVLRRAPTWAAPLHVGWLLNWMSGLLQAASLVAVVLGCLPRLGGCAHIAARLVRSLAAGRPGRTALAGGSGRWWDKHETQTLIP
jgi:hypothetical protein